MENTNMLLRPPSRAGSDASDTTISLSDSSWSSSEFGPPTILRRTLTGMRPLVFGGEMSFEMVPDPDERDYNSDDDKGPVVIDSSAREGMLEQIPVTEEQWNEFVTATNRPMYGDDEEEMYAGWDLEDSQDYDPNGSAVQSMLRYAHSMAVMSSMYQFDNSNPVQSGHHTRYGNQVRRRRRPDIRVVTTHSATNWPQSPTMATSPCSSVSSAMTCLPSPTESTSYVPWVSSLPTPLDQFLGYINSHAQASAFATCFQTRLSHLYDRALDANGTFIGTMAMKEDMVALEGAIDLLRRLAPVGR
ncbi:uncharacterized protein SPPG_05923 [Spizellomyces punctatus DAOM BR117]|uniref:Uncharacterized protein n=1 Tax=Spizellomyces punctatus (strain DAOM BR117) TaxID=645134 RepID=A0A0L0HCS4_SPIPD|nr:uncharacterized protein SPPG_05923 [Spizellomyces punctatus DAOM BR117]KNC98967.1 hypothetical protein SPPG_05923 [Spizellomyces punctatus DAOM BR117]|eukprot:XP_016607007.1 hypothetical protein SPPG_05923 [Spizellomyces punctatus DAOM BR117]